MFVSDGNISEIDLDDLGVVGPSAEIDPAQCYTQEEVNSQSVALAQIAAQREAFEQVTNYVAALFNIANGIDAAVEQASMGDVKLALGAFPEDIREVNDNLSAVTFELADTIREFASVVADKYGVTI